MVSPDAADVQRAFTGGSGAGPLVAHHGIGPAQVRSIEWACKRARDDCGFDFVVWISSDTSRPVRARAEDRHATLKNRDRTVLVHVDPARRQVEIVTGTEVTRTLTDSECRLAAVSIAASAANGDLSAGLVTGITQMGEAARGQVSRHLRPTADR